MARQHFKTTGLCSHTTPDGKSIIGELGRLEKKFRKGDITEEELQAYCLMIHGSKKPSLKISGKLEFDVPIDDRSFKTVIIFGREMQVTIEDYKKHYAHLGF